MRRNLWILAIAVAAAAVGLAIWKEWTLQRVASPPNNARSRIEVFEGAVSVRAGDDETVVKGGEFVLADGAGVSRPRSARKVSEPTPTVHPEESGDAVDIVRDLGPQIRDVGGIVCDEAGAGLRDVSLTIAVTGEAGETSGCEMRSEPDGGFQFPLLATQTYRVSATLAGRIPANASGGFFDEDPRLVLPKRGAVRGRVTDENDGPVGFAAVTIRSVTRAAPGAFVTTILADQKGVFQSAGELLPGTYRISAKQAEYADAGEGTLEYTLVSPPEELALRLVSERYSISGFVLERGTDTGLPGMKLLLRAWSHSGHYNEIVSETQTGEGGGFLFEDILPGEYAVFGVDNPEAVYSFSGHSGVMVSIRHASLDSVTLYAARRSVVSGTVVDADGSPSAGAVVQNTERWPKLRTESGADGAFTIALPPGDFRRLENQTRLWAEKTEDARTRSGFSDWLKIEPGESLTGVVIELEDGIAVSGRVLSTAGEGVPGATVTLSESFTGKTQTARAGVFGEYRFEDVAGSEWGSSPFRYAYHLKAEAEGYATAHHMFGSDSGEGDIQRDLVLEPALRIAGRVTDGEGRPLESVRVSYQTPHMAGGTGPSTGSDGSYVLENLEPGNYQLTFQYGKRPPRAGRLFGVPAGTQNADIVLEHPLITVIVELEIEGEIEASQPYAAHADRRLANGGFSRSFMLGGLVSEKSFSFKLWDPGTYQLRCFVPDCPVASTWIVIGDESEEDTIQVKLTIGPPTGSRTVVGRVMLPDGFGCDFVTGPFESSFPIGPSGAFSVDNVPSGPIALAFWPYDETGIPMRINVFLDGAVEDGGVVDVGEVSLIAEIQRLGLIAR